MTIRRIFILIDALGWEKVCEVGFMPQLSGTRRRLKTVLGYSGACQAALLSGTPPSKNGHWLMYYFTPRTETFRAALLLRPLPGWLKNRGRVRGWVKQQLEKRGRVRGYYSLYHVPVEALPYLDLAEKEDLYAPGGLGPMNTIFDELGRTGTPYSVWNWRVPEEESLERLLGELREDRKQFYFVYWNRLDGLMHQNGTGAKAVDAHIAWYSSAIERILGVASRGSGDGRVFVFSDHGMMDTSGTIDLMGPVSALGFRYGKDYLAFYDSTMARFRFFSEDARRGVVSVLSEQGAGDLLDDETLERLGVRFPDRRYGDVIFLTHPGVLIVPSFMGPTVPKAMHGFHPHHPESDAALLSNVEVRGCPESVMDLYGVMRQELDG